MKQQQTTFHAHTVYLRTADTEPGIITFVFTDGGGRGGEHFTPREEEEEWEEEEETQMDKCFYG